MKTFLLYCVLAMPLQRVLSAGDWPMLAGSPSRSNVSSAVNLPIDIDIRTGRNVKWIADLGSVAFGNIVLADGKIYVGTNNGAGYLARFPNSIDLACLLCFDLSDGRFLWQYSSTKHPAGRVHDWPLRGLCSAPAIEGDRLWFVSNRGEIVCLDAQGFTDGENDGPFRGEDFTTDDEADIVWRFDMMETLGVRPHQRSTCAPLIRGNILYVCTSNGVSEIPGEIPAPDAPSFLALNKRTGEVLWTDNSPGKNILDGQWASPAIGEFAGVPQVIFPGGDGWVYAFHADCRRDGKPIPLWQYDANAKSSTWNTGGSGTRNAILASPVVADNKVYLVTGNDPEFGEGPAELWCIDPTKRGDISAELALAADGSMLPRRRVQAIDVETGERAIPNPNSGVVWRFAPNVDAVDPQLEYPHFVRRSVTSPAIADGLLYLADLGGIVHCIDARTGQQLWTHDCLSPIHASPLIADGKVFVADEDGDLVIFRHHREKDLLAEVAFEDAVYVNPVAVGETLYVATRSSLYAIEQHRGK